MWWFSPFTCDCFHLCFVWDDVLFLVLSLLSPRLVVTTQTESIKSCKSVHKPSTMAMVNSSQSSKLSRSTSMAMSASTDSTWIFRCLSCLGFECRIEPRSIYWHGPDPVNFDESETVDFRDLMDLKLLSLQFHSI